MENTRPQDMSISELMALPLWHPQITQRIGVPNSSDGVFLFEDNGPWAAVKDKGVWTRHYNGGVFACSGD